MLRQFRLLRIPGQLFLVAFAALFPSRPAGELGGPCVSVTFDAFHPQVLGMQAVIELERLLNGPPVEGCKTGPEHSSAKEEENRRVIPHRTRCTAVLRWVLPHAR